MSTCRQCGITVHTKKRMQTEHKESLWHNFAPLAKELRRQGKSFSEIARRLGFSRAYVGQRFNRWGKK